MESYISGKPEIAQVIISPVPIIIKERLLNKRCAIETITISLVSISLDLTKTKVLLNLGSSKFCDSVFSVALLKMGFFLHKPNL